MNLITKNLKIITKLKNQNFAVKLQINFQQTKI